MLGGVYQFEYSLMLERPHEGITIAKLKGKPVNIVASKTDGENKRP
jgi:hypothetical protein